MNYPRIYADFHNTDEQGRLRLNCIGTIEDLNRQHIQLQNSQSLTLHSEDLEVDGLVQYSEDDRIWVAVIDWNAVREVEEMRLKYLSLKFRVLSNKTQNPD